MSATRLILTVQDSSLSVSADTTRLVLGAPIPATGGANGPAGGQLSGFYPNPSVVGITETDGPTALSIGDVLDGEFLKRVGTTIQSQTLKWVEDEFTPSADGQISFSLTRPPLDADSINVIVNGIEADDGVNYTISGQTLTWLNVPYTLETTDKLIVRYR